MLKYSIYAELNSVNSITFVQKFSLMKNIAIFASGSGTNAEKIMEYFKNSERINIALIISDNKNAGVLQRADKFGVKTLIISKSDLHKPIDLINLLNQHKITLIVLAGFLRKIPETMIKAFPNQIINIHPALLPKYGGKGMYGDFVHKSVIANKEKESGITIHYVNENYDEGAIIFQAKCSVEETDNPDDLATKIHLLEHNYFSVTIENVLKGI